MAGEDSKDKQLNDLVQTAEEQPVFCQSEDNPEKTKPCGFQSSETHVEYSSNAPECAGESREGDLQCASKVASSEEASSEESTATNEKGVEVVSEDVNVPCSPTEESISPVAEGHDLISQVSKSVTEGAVLSAESDREGIKPLSEKETVPVNSDGSEIVESALDSIPGDKDCTIADCSEELSLDQKGKQQDTSCCESESNNQEQVCLQAEVAVSGEQSECKSIQDSEVIEKHTDADTEEDNCIHNLQEATVTADQSSQCTDINPNNMTEPLKEPNMTRREPLAQLQNLNVTQLEKNIGGPSGDCSAVEQDTILPISCSNTSPVIESTDGNVGKEPQRELQNIDLLSNREEPISFEEGNATKAASCQKMPDVNESTEVSDETQSQFSCFIEALQQLDECRPSTNTTNTSTNELPLSSSAPSSKSSMIDGHPSDSTGNNSSSSSPRHSEEPHTEVFGNEETPEISKSNPGSTADVQQKSSNLTVLNSISCDSNIPDAQNKDHASATLALESDVTTFLSLDDSDEFPITRNLSDVAASDNLPAVSQAEDDTATQQVDSAVPRVEVNSQTTTHEQASNNSEQSAVNTQVHTDKSPIDKTLPVSVCPEVLGNSSTPVTVSPTNESSSVLDNLLKEVTALNREGGSPATSITTEINLNEQCESATVHLGVASSSMSSMEQVAIGQTIQSGSKVGTENYVSQSSSQGEKAPGETIEITPIVVTPEGTSGSDSGSFHYEIPNQSSEESGSYDNTPSLDSYMMPPTPSIFGQPIVIAPSGCEELDRIENQISTQTTTASESTQAAVTDVDEDCLITFAKVKPPAASPPETKPVIRPAVPSATVRPSTLPSRPSQGELHVNSLSNIPFTQHQQGTMPQMNAPPNITAPPRMMAHQGNFTMYQNNPVSSLQPNLRPPPPLINAYGTRPNPVNWRQPLQQLGEFRAPGPVSAPPHSQPQSYVHNGGINNSQYPNSSAAGRLGALSQTGARLPQQQTPHVVQGQANNYVQLSVVQERSLANNGNVQPQPYQANVPLNALASISESPLMQSRQMLDRSLANVAHVNPQQFQSGVAVNNMGSMISGPRGMTNNPFQAPVNQSMVAGSHHTPVTHAWNVNHSTGSGNTGHAYSLSPANNPHLPNALRATGPINQNSSQYSSGQSQRLVPVSTSGTSIRPLSSPETGASLPYNLSNQWMDSSTPVSQNTAWLTNPGQLNSQQPSAHMNQALPSNNSMNTSPPIQQQTLSHSNGTQRNSVSPQQALSNYGNVPRSANAPQPALPNYRGLQRITNVPQQALSANTSATRSSNAAQQGLPNHSSTPLSRNVSQQGLPNYSNVQRSSNVLHQELSNPNSVPRSINATQQGLPNHGSAPRSMNVPQPALPNYSNVQRSSNVVQQELSNPNSVPRSINATQQGLPNHGSAPRSMNVPQPALPNYSNVQRSSNILRQELSNPSSLPTGTNATQQGLSNTVQRIANAPQQGSSQSSVSKSSNTLPLALHENTALGSTSDLQTLTVPSQTSRSQPSCPALSNLLSASDNLIDLTLLPVADKATNPEEARTTPVYYPCKLTVGDITARLSLPQNRNVDPDVYNFKIIGDKVLERNSACMSKNNGNAICGDDDVVITGYETTKRLPWHILVVVSLYDSGRKVVWDVGILGGCLACVCAPKMQGQDLCSPNMWAVNIRAPAKLKVYVLQIIRKIAKYARTPSFWRDTEKYLSEGNTTGMWRGFCKPPFCVNVAFTKCPRLKAAAKDIPQSTPSACPQESAGEINLNFQNSPPKNPQGRVIGELSLTNIPLPENSPNISNEQRDETQTRPTSASNVPSTQASSEQTLIHDLLKQMLQNNPANDDFSKKLSQYLNGTNVPESGHSEVDGESNSTGVPKVSLGDASTVISSSSTSTSTSTCTLQETTTTPSQRETTVSRPPVLIQPAELVKHKGVSSRDITSVRRPPGSPVLSSQSSPPSVQLPHVSSEIRTTGEDVHTLSSPTPSTSLNSDIFKKTRLNSAVDSVEEMSSNQRASSSSLKRKASTEMPSIINRNIASSQNLAQPAASTTVPDFMSYFQLGPGKMAENTPELQSDLGGGIVPFPGEGLKQDEYISVGDFWGDIEEPTSLGKTPKLLLNSRSQRIYEYLQKGPKPVVSLKRLTAADIQRKNKQLRKTQKKRQRREIKKSNKRKRKRRVSSWNDYDSHQGDFTDSDSDEEPFLCNKKRKTMKKAEMYLASLVSQLDSDSDKDTRKGRGRSQSKDSDSDAEYDPSIDSSDDSDTGSEVTAVETDSSDSDSEELVTVKPRRRIKQMIVSDSDDDQEDEQSEIQNREVVNAEESLSDKEEKQKDSASKAGTPTSEGVGIDRLKQFLPMVEELCEKKTFSEEKLASNSIPVTEHSNKAKSTKVEERRDSRSGTKSPKEDYAMPTKNWGGASPSDTMISSDPLDNLTSEELWNSLISRKTVIMCDCGLIFKEQPLFYLHKSTHSTDNPLQCSMCHLTLKDYESFMAHFFDGHSQRS